MDETKKDEVKAAASAADSAEATTAKESPSEPKEEKAEVKVPAKFAKIVEEVEKMSVLDLNELVKVFENKFGVSATAVAAPSAQAGGGEAKEEKSTFNVELVDSGAQKIAIIKIVKEVLALGLKDAKDKVDAAPTVLVENMKKEEAEALKKRIEEAGGKVVLK